MPDTRTDRELVDLILGNDRGAAEAAWVEVIRRYKRLIYFIPSSRFEFQRHHSDDVFSVVLEKLVKAIHTWTGTTNFRSFVGETTTNVCLDMLRLRKRRAEVPVDGIDPPIDTQPTTLEIALLNQQRDLLRAAMRDVLSPRDQELFQFWLWGYSYEEIARSQNITVGNVGVIVNRAKKRVGETLSDV